MNVLLKSFSFFCVTSSSCFSKSLFDKTNFKNSTSTNGTFAKSFETSNDKLCKEIDCFHKLLDKIMDTGVKKEVRIMEKGVILGKLEGLIKRDIRAEKLDEEICKLKMEKNILKDLTKPIYCSHNLRTIMEEFNNRYFNNYEAEKSERDKILQCVGNYLNEMKTSYQSLVKYFYWELDQTSFHKHWIDLKKKKLIVDPRNGTINMAVSKLIKAKDGTHAWALFKKQKTSVWSNLSLLMDWHEEWLFNLPADKIKQDLIINCELNHQQHNFVNDYIDLIEMGMKKTKITKRLKECLWVLCMSKDREVAKLIDNLRTANSTETSYCQLWKHFDDGEFRRNFCIKLDQLYNIVSVLSFHKNMPNQFLQNICPINSTDYMNYIRSLALGDELLENTAVILSMKDSLAKSNNNQ